MRPRRTAGDTGRRCSDSQKLLAPALEIEQRPDEQAAILRAGEVLVDERCHRMTIEEFVNPRLRFQQPPPDVVDAVALEPAGIRRRKPLLLALADIGGDVSREHLTQQQLAIRGSAEELL